MKDMTFTEIAVAFSNGAFAKVYPFLHETIEWEVIGESVYSGKAAVMEQCASTAAYFESVTTVFTTESVLTEGHQVAVSGTAEFIRNQQRVAFVKACDLYLFNEEGKLVSIRSYCIPEKK
jgi:ketosteroid isomerase-like protein